MVAQARAVVVQHSPKGGARRVGQWLTGAGVGLDVIHAYDGDAVPEPGHHDAVVVLGGGFMCDDDRAVPWLPATRSLVQHAVDHSVPVLGICLGAQLLAQVTGGSVTANAGAPEHGSTTISVRADAGDDPLFRDLPSDVTAIEHHKDAITALPPGAVWLAASERCPYQAFRVGDKACGVQFHPEVGPDRLLEWDTSELRLAGLDRDTLHSQAKEDDGPAAPTWEKVTRRFAATVLTFAARREARPGGS